MHKNLFTLAMRGDWEGVAKIYEEDPSAHLAKLARQGDSALHLAISGDADESVVEKLVSLVLKQPHHQQALQIQNDEGSTPLHYAAIRGNVRMCKCIAEANPPSMGFYNQQTETPFFMAVLRGRKKAFLWLHSFVGTQQGYKFCTRKKDGDTILHSAIAGEYVDLAYQIICWYPALANVVNKKGFTPLHTLATIPTAFESGTYLDIYQKFIYHCKSFSTLKHLLNFDDAIGLLLHIQVLSFYSIFVYMVGTYVDEFKPEIKERNNSIAVNTTKDEQNSHSHTQNQKLTPSNLICFLKNTVQLASGKRNGKEERRKTDTENPQNSRSDYIKSIEATGHQSTLKTPKHCSFLPICNASSVIFKLLLKIMLAFLGLGFDIKQIKEKKQKHVWSIQVMDELLKTTSMYEYEEIREATPKQPYQHELEKEIINPYDPINLRQEHISETKVQVHESEGGSERETAFLAAGKNGIIEMVRKILKQFPVAINDMNSEKKNILLLSVEHRQPHIYKFLVDSNVLNKGVIWRRDRNGDSALHHTAKLGKNKPWLIPGAAMQMHWEIKWYEFVRTTIPPYYFIGYNFNGKTAEEIFSETHKELVKEGGEWLTKTSEACSVVAALIATVAFTSSTNVPGGINERNGKPLFENRGAFEIFAVSSLIALCCSVTALVFFLSILTSRFDERDFNRSLPRKLLFGLTSLFASIAAILVTFCAGHFFVLEDKLKYTALLPVYAVTSLPISFFAIAQFPLYFDLIWATFKEVPERGYNSVK